MTTEKDTLVARLTSELARNIEEQHQLRARLAELEHERFAEAQILAVIEDQHSTLASRFIAADRLHESLERDEIIAVIKEIVANLIGSEEMGLYEVDEAGGRLRLVASVGIDAERLGELPLSGMLSTIALAPQPFVVLPNSPTEPCIQSLSAWIPLVLAGRVTHGVAVFRLLPQKAAIVASDYDLFQVLATHAATSLYSSRLHERFGQNEL